MWAVLTVVFVAFRLAPGDPAQAAMLQSTASEEVLQQRREALGLHLPPLAQYARYMGSLVQADLGISWATGQRVDQVLVQQLQPTIELAIAGLIFAVIMGMGLGYTSAVLGSALVGRLSRTLTGVILSVPIPFLGIAFATLFAVHLQWLPATGQGEIKHLILPGLVVGLSTCGGLARAIDAGISRVLSQPFLITARAKGLTRQQALWRHGLRIAALPALDLLALQLGFLLSGAVITETLFARQGLGRVLLSAVLNRDLPVLQAVVTLSALVYTMLNVLADMAHSWLDPRIRFQG